MVVCKFTSYKAKEAILKKARRIKPQGPNIFEDLAQETMEKRRAQLPSSNKLTGHKLKTDWLNSWLNCMNI